MDISGTGVLAVVEQSGKARGHQNGGVAPFPLLANGWLAKHDRERVMLRKIGCRMPE